MTPQTNAPWWSAKSDGEMAFKRLIPLVTQIKTRQATRYQTMRRYATVYEYGFNATDRITAKARFVDDSKLTFNYAQNVVDTIVAQVATPRVVPLALTEGGSYSSRQKAKDLTQCFEGQWDECDIDSVKEQIITDACIFEGVGIAKAYPSANYDSLVIERVLPFDIYVDDAECRLGKPRSIFHRQSVDRYVALAEWGGPDSDLVGSAKHRREKILKCPSGKSDDDVEPNQDIIEVWEAWHLPSRVADPNTPGDKGSGDGRHVIAIDGCDLVDEPWDEPRFPFAKFCPKKSRAGWWGIPAMRQLSPGQKEYERVTDKLQRAHRKMGGSHFVVGRGAKLQKRQMTNDVGDIWDCDDINQVRDFQPTPANPQTYQYRDGIVQDMLRSTGNSTFSAQGAVPPGLAQASGKALEVFADENSKYHILWHREVERWTLDMADLIKMTVRHILDVNPNFSARYREKRGYRVLKWADLIDVDHAIRIFNTSMLASTPAAKFAQLSELLQAGAITPEMFRRLFELPDFEAENDVIGADLEILLKSLDHIVMTGQYISPQPTDDLGLALKTTGSFISMCRVQEVPDARLDLLRRYATDVQALLQIKSVTDAPAPTGELPGAPPGMPMPGAPMPPGAPPMMPPGPMMPPQGGPPPMAS